MRGQGWSQTTDPQVGLQLLKGVGRRHSYKREDCCVGVLNMECRPSSATVSGKEDVEEPGD